MRQHRAAVVVVLACAAGAIARAQPPARPRPPLPKFDQPVLFNTPAADAILSAMQVFPPDNPWNADVSKLPVHPDSEKMVAQIGADKHVGCNLDMAFVLVPPRQPRVPVKLVGYPEESDKGPYPVPGNAPIEGWPLEGGTLETIQRNGRGDRHLLVVDPWNGALFEFGQARRTDAGWQASCAAAFDLKTGALRPKGWTSSDAAGLPVFPAVVRFDECERGRVEHAMRFTVRRSRKACIPPATHQAGHTTDPAAPAMGQRFRLKASVDVSGFPRHAQAVALGLQKHGMFVADNGGDWLLSVAPDERLKGLEALRKLTGGDFEVVLTPGDAEAGRPAR